MSAAGGVGVLPPCDPPTGPCFAGGGQEVHLPYAAPRKKTKTHPPHLGDLKQQRLPALARPMRLAPQGLSRGSNPPQPGWASSHLRALWVSHKGAILRNLRECRGSLHGGPERSPQGRALWLISSTHPAPHPVEKLPALPAALPTAARALLPAATTLQ